MRYAWILLICFCTAAFAEIKAVAFDYGGVIAHFDHDAPLNPASPHFHEQICAATTETPGIIDFIAQLKQRGYMVVLLSNITKGAASHIRQMGYYAPFDKLFLSYEMGNQKPQPEIYTTFLEQMPCAPEEILFIDDREENVIAAKQHGINAIQFTTLEELMKHTYERG